MVQNINKALKVSRLLATSLEILVANTQFSVALATSWSQFRTLQVKKNWPDIQIWTPRIEPPGPNQQAKMDSPVKLLPKKFKRESGHLHINR